MKINELTEKYRFREQLRNKLEAVEQVRKDISAQIDSIEREICDAHREDMLSDFTVDGVRYYAKLNVNYSIPENKSDHSKKVELLNHLIEIGHGDDVTLFQSGFIHGQKLKKVLLELENSQVAKMVENGWLSTYEKPEIRGYKVKS